MQTKATAKESATHASRSFFESREMSASPFFAPMIQAKCTACEDEDKVRRTIDAGVAQERSPPVPAVVPLADEEIPGFQTKCSACDQEPPKPQRRTTSVQSKLTVGTPNDRFEREADNTADSVMRMPDPAMKPVATSMAGPEFIQREADATESCSIQEEKPEPDEEHEETEDVDPDDAKRAADPKDTKVSPKRDAAGPSTPTDLESRIDSTKGGGSSLPARTRDFMESRFGHDFSSVRIHTGAESAAMNRDVRSYAFTTGSDIYFAPGQYRPDTDSGKHLLAHELTHVIQQTGQADGVVREKTDRNQISRATGDPETKWYHRTHYVSGTATHGVIEKLLRASDTLLVTEAAIPGADRNAPDINKVGRADLYMSVPSLTVSGVKAVLGAEKEQNIWNMDDPTSRKMGTLPSVNSSPTRPDRTKKSGRGWKGKFPSKIYLGELKPWSTTKAGAGVAQLDSYKIGYNAFARRVNELSGGVTGESISFENLKLNLPTYLDFDQWDSEHSKPERRTTYGDRRIWVAYIGGGVYLYNDLAKSLEEPPPEYFTKYLAKMRELKKSMTDGHPRTDKMVNTKALPVSRNAVPKVARRIQRNTKDRNENYWKERGTAWETQRSAWGRDFRTYLGSKLKGHREKVRFAKKIGKASKGGHKLSAVASKEVQQYKSLMFWSGRGGKFLGKVRFLLGSAWDKIIGVFERKKKPMEDLRGKVKGIDPGGMTKISWKSQLLRVVVGACKAVFTAFIVESFNFFAECFHSAMDKLTKRFEEEVNEKFGEEICRARLQFEESKARLETEWGDIIVQIGKLVEDVRNIQRWINIVGTMVDLIRIGVQVVSCLSPPGLGCLWGLVAQLGIGAMVGLVIGTQWFNDTIITPNVRTLLDLYIAPTYQKLINNILGPKLADYHCHVADDSIPSMKFEAKGGLEEGSAGLRAHRDAWQAEFEPELLKDLQRVFGKPGGKKATKEDLLALVKKINESGLSMQEFKDRATMQALLEQARDPKSGKLDLEKARTEAEKTEVPERQATDRKIDYDNARKQNATFQKMRGWDPTTFIAKPGIKAESEEFADAVYDMQGKVRVKQDGILGDDTLIAFYDKNKKKADSFYDESARAIADKKAAAERAAKEKADREKAAKEKAAADRELASAKKGLPPDVKVLTAHECTPSKRGNDYPKGVRFDIVDFWSYFEWTENPKSYKVPKSPQVIHLDVTVNKVHKFRILNVAVKELKVVNVFGGCYWTAWLDLLDGIELETGNGTALLISDDWCLSVQ